MKGIEMELIYSFSRALYRTALMIPLFLQTACFPIVRIPQTYVHELHFLFDGEPRVIKSKVSCSSSVAVLSAADGKFHSQWHGTGMTPSARVQVAPGVVLTFEVFAECGYDKALEAKSYRLRLAANSNPGTKTEDVPIRYETEIQKIPASEIYSDNPAVHFPDWTWQTTTVKTETVSFGGHTVKFLKALSRPVEADDGVVEYRSPEHTSPQ